MRLVNPSDWRVENLRPKGTQAPSINADVGEPILTLVNASGNRLHVHPISDRLVRVVHKLAPEALQVKLDDRHRHPTGRDGVAWETVEGSCGCEWTAEHVPDAKIVNLLSPEGIQITVNFANVVRLTWAWPSSVSPFLCDFKTAYMYDQRSGRVFHYVEREGYKPLSEHHRSANDNHLQPHDDTTEFLYGLGETKGPMLKTGKRYILDARDSLAYDVEETDPLYKLCPFYLLYNSSTNFWLGMYYNSLAPSVADFGAEHDFSTGDSRSFSIEQGALDYYVLLGASSFDSQSDVQARASPAPKPRLRDIVSQLAALVTPHVTASHQFASDAPRLPRNVTPNWQASPTLPRLASFGYLASSMTLAELDNAQEAVGDYVIETRQYGFPVDGMHLSSGYCLDEQSGERMYFLWNKTKYPDPPGLGNKLEKQLQCHLIINVKPWLLEGHKWYKEAALAGAFVKAAKDALVAGGKGTSSVTLNDSSRTYHWSASMGQTAAGSHVDFSSKAGSDFWQKAIRHGVAANGITGLWIDNNEFSTLIDDAQRIAGEVNGWAAPEQAASSVIVPTPKSVSEKLAQQVEDRMGWRGGEIEVGAVGRATLTMGMAKASWEQMARTDPSTRPIVVTRSAVPGIQAYAHGTWSGDNSTTWKCLKYNTKMTLSVGLSFGAGLYGHDIGGFAGAHSPSPELLVRWCQQSVWHSRFTLHSWKAISTTFYMYADQKDVMDALLDALRLRYQLVPMLYSLYIAEYQRKGWPVLRPLLWKHSNVRACLGQDEQFLLGDTILAAPALDFGAREVVFNLPFLVDGADGDAPLTECWWYDLHGQQWIKPEKRGQAARLITLPAPLSYCPTLIRENGLLILAGRARATVFDQDARLKRTIQLFPAAADRKRTVEAITFTLIEDDGITNEAMAGAFTEFALTCCVQSGREASEVLFRIDARNKGYPGSWQWTLELPAGDARKIIVEDNSGTVKVDGVQKGNTIALTVTVP
ncbi:glycoside hydrolase family 31 protein [Tilletiaria anomala UBC 951]|uniref:Glycoside hydrolase family 31 protein n=1 Tax=Tilletiaria anomala (strain ATCC 24038 / CBS 436.72 / UBC 951) TaxID=1037660 RepID=A0A066WK89_TILAU|nr:glycoside hydrolase family 31 protein [Tilletiaria anomala UBC 951]KDN51434.1 glycoside hydrolase family 31 protein [Tilletiaria anomala UBC 951]